jgi:lysophospholipase L1-like esterase
MIKNFKWLVLVSLTIVACSSNDEDSTPVDVPVTAGSADFSKYVAIGDSFAAGYSDNALFKKGQENSYPSILSQQFEEVGGGEFKIPFMSDNIGGFSIGGSQISLFPTRLVFNGAAPVNVPGVSGTAFGVAIPGIYNNMGVPGAKSFHLTFNGYANANPYFGRFASSPTATIIGDALIQEPTFFSLWIGGNDVLGYATNGGIPTSQDPTNGNDITPTATFDAVYTGIAAQLAAGGRKGVVANLPYVSSLPFFTTVPYNPLTALTIGLGNQAVGEATIQALNAQLYGPLKLALTAVGAGDRINLLSLTEGNPLLIKDETLTNLSDDIKDQLTPIIGLPTATAFGQVFGQARQTKKSVDGTFVDYVLLTTKSAIGSTSPASAPLDKYGITYPLEDKHVLIQAEVAEIKAATDAYNITIQNAAEANDLAFVDTKSVMNQLVNGGISFGNYHMSTSFAVGGAFSLDGVHPCARGYALIANKFMEAINAKYGSTFKPVDLGKYRVQYPAVITD